MQIYSRKKLSKKRYKEANKQKKNTTINKNELTMRTYRDDIAHRILDK